MGNVQVADTSISTPGGGAVEVKTTTTVGIIANPASARDVRRLVAHGGAVTTHDKLNQLQRVLAGLAATGVERVISMADRAGIMASLDRLADRASAQGWPALEFVDQTITQTEADTTTATQAMVDAGVGAVVVLGGDGTNRVVAAASANVPLVSISTGTNNAFPRPVEPTVAGLAAGLIATNGHSRQAGTYRAKKLLVHCGDRVEEALVDVAIVNTDGVGSGALWDSTSISELLLSFAEPDAIGLSAIGGHVQPTSRRSPAGLTLLLGEPAAMVVQPPIAPGLLSPVGVRLVSVLEFDSPVVAETAAGVIAIDGERMFRFGPADRPTITLRSDGPVVVDVTATLEHAANHGLLAPTSGIASPAMRLPVEAPPTSARTTDLMPRGYQCETTQTARPLHRDGPHPAVRVPDPAGIPR